VAHIFDVTASAEKAAVLNTEGTGEVCFTVTNVTNAPVKARAVMGPERSLALAWLTLVGDAERYIQPHQSDTFVVKVKVPAGTKPGDYGFRLDAISVSRPDEDSTQGPTIAIPVTLAPPPHKPFPWWILAAAAVVIGGLSYAALKLIPNNDAIVPDLSSKNLTEARGLLAAQHLKVGNIDNLLSDRSKVDLVIKQSPPSQTKVPPGSAINFQIGVAVVPVPPLKGSLEDAQKALRDAHLDVGEIKSVNQPGATPGVVLASDPAEGNTVQSHVKVALTVQAGSVDVPDLTGQNLFRAALTLINHNLKHGNVTGLPITIDDSDVKRIRELAVPLSDWSHKGQSVPVGTPVDLIFPGQVRGQVEEQGVSQFLKILDTASTSELEKMDKLFGRGYILGSPMGR
jgi:PASTA domain